MQFADGHSLGSMVKEPDETWKEKLRSVDASMAHARKYLDRTAHRYPEHFSLPRAFWRKTDGRLALAVKSEGRCGDRAIFEDEQGAVYSPSVLLELLFDVSDHPITTVSMRLP